MHPEVRQDHPGNCPKCGMTLEPIIPLDEEDNHELKDFQRRFWWTLPLTVIVTILAMFGHRLGMVRHGNVQTWVELVLSLPVVLWTGWPFFVRGWQSLVHRSPNMWTLIGLGTGAAFSTASWPPWRRACSRTRSFPWGAWLCTSRRRWSSSR
jgi:Cu+-exporting ATPase